MSLAGGAAPAAMPAGGVDRVGRPYAAGGLVAGQPGIDRISARLSAGEYVLSRQAVDVVGSSFLDRLNRQPAGFVQEMSAPKAVPSVSATSPSGTSPRTGMAAATPAGSTHLQTTRSTVEHHQQTVNHFGGIHLQVQQMQDVGDVLQTLHSQEFALRNRRG